MIYSQLIRRGGGQGISSISSLVEGWGTNAFRSLCYTEEKVISFTPVVGKAGEISPFLNLEQSWERSISSISALVNKGSQGQERDRGITSNPSVAGEARPESCGTEEVKRNSIHSSTLALTLRGTQDILGPLGLPPAGVISLDVYNRVEERRASGHGYIVNSRGQDMSFKDKYNEDDHTENWGRGDVPPSRLKILSLLRMIFFLL